MVISQVGGYIQVHQTDSLLVTTIERYQLGLGQVVAITCIFLICSYTSSGGHTNKGSNVFYGLAAKILSTGRDGGGERIRHNCETNSLTIIIV